MTTFHDSATNDGTDDDDSAGVTVPEDVEVLIVDTSTRFVPMYLCQERQLLRQVTLPQGLRTIGVQAFFRCSQLRSITIPGTVERIEQGAFGQCHRLVQVTFVEGVKMAIGMEAFHSCKSLSTVKIPSSVHTIEEGAFFMCDELFGVELSEGLQSIGRKAFAKCYFLSAIKIPATVTSIGEYAFYSCQNLITVEVSAASRAQVAADAFQNCVSLVNICLPKGMIVTDSSFSDCDELDNQFPEDSIVNNLRSRFDHFPVHKLCYYSSDTTVLELNNKVLLDDASNLRLLEDDQFGMTPLHVLSSASTGRPDLLEVLLDSYYPFHRDVIRSKDVLGRRATDHLVSKAWTTKEWIAMMRILLNRWMLDRLCIWGTELWRTNVQRDLNELLAEDDTEQEEFSPLQRAAQRHSALQRLCDKFDFYDHSWSCDSGKARYYYCRLI